MFARRVADGADVNLTGPPIARSAGVEFIDENGGGPGVRLRKPAKERLRR
jgi:hypothetical protein